MTARDRCTEDASAAHRDHLLQSRLSAEGKPLCKRVVCLDDVRSRQWWNSALISAEGNIIATFFRLGFPVLLQVDILPKAGYALGCMSTREEKQRLELLQGRLHFLVLRTLIFGPQHGQGIARAIQQSSEQELLVETARFTRHSSAWNRVATFPPSGARPATTARRFYQLTKAGRKQLVKETAKWERLVAATGRILESTVAEG